MDKRRWRNTQQVLRRAAQHGIGRGAGEADASVGTVTGDEIHRVVGKEAIHRSAFGGGMIGDALAILRGDGDERRLHHRRQNRSRIELPGRRGQAGIGKLVQQLQQCHHEQRDRGGGARFPDGAASAGQRGFGGNEREPHQQRRCHPAGDRDKITDQRREAGERDGFQRTQAQPRESEHGHNGRQEQAADGDPFGDVGFSDDRDEQSRKECADNRLGCLHDHESTALGGEFRSRHSRDRFGYGH